MKLLLHICCAPCLQRYYPAWQDIVDSGTLTGLFYNPNIHPLIEYRRRQKALSVYADRLKLPWSILYPEQLTTEIQEYHWRQADVAIDLSGTDTTTTRDIGYGLTFFCNKLARQNAYESPGRCSLCYNMRLEFVAWLAKMRGFTHFSSTLLTSQEQNTGVIRAVGQRIAAKWDLEFVAPDFTEYTTNLPEYSPPGIYRQSYCGCIFSEYDRFHTTDKHLYWF